MPDPFYTDVETELRGHPRVVDCAVSQVQTAARRKTLVAYVVVSGSVRDAALLTFLKDRTPGRVPSTVVRLRSLPRHADGSVDYESLPQPVIPGKVVQSSKGGTYTQEPLSLGCAVGLTSLVVAALAFLATDFLWEHSTDLTGVPQPWATFFFILYIAECLSFGLGVAFLLFGRPLLTRQRRPRRLTFAAYLSLAWLLAAWWPQDNFYRLAAKTDWPRQAALVYGFNITLMLAAGALVLFVATKPVRAVD